MRKFRSSHVGALAVVLVGCGGVPDSSPTPSPGTVVSTELGATGRLPNGADHFVDHAAVPFVPVGAQWVAQAGALEARHDGRALRLTPLESEIDPENGTLHGDALVLSTARLSVGGTALTTGTIAFPTSTGGVSIVGGEFVERFDAHYGDVEQTWDFATHPSASGDLVVRIAASGPTFTTHTTSGLHFMSPEGLGFSYGIGRWIDAAGAGVDVIPTWENNEIVLRVPRAVLDASAFPARLDPTITAEKAVDAPIAGSPTGSGSLFADVAFSGAQYLAVWQDQRTDFGDIFGVRLSTTGALLDTLSIAVGGKESGIQARPVVAFINNQYLAVWENQTTGTLEASRVLPATGAVTSLGAVVSLGSPAQKPHIAVRGNEALIVFQTGNDVQGVIYGSSNTFGTPFAIATTSDQENDPAVASSAGNYLVSWSKGVVDATGAVKTSIQAQQVTSTGALSGAAFDISLGQGDLLVPTSSSVGGNFVVAWERVLSGSGTSVYLTRVSPSGAVLDTHTEVLTGTTTTQTFGGKALLATRGNLQPWIACAATNCLISYSDVRNNATTGFDIFAQLVDGTLAPIAAESAVSTVIHNQILPHAAVAGTGYFVAWSDARDTNSKIKSAFGARVSSAGAVLDASGILLARGNNREQFVAAARSTTSWLVGWQDSRVAGDNIVGTRVSDAFAISDDPSIDISNAAAGQATPAMATDPTTGNYMVVWGDSHLFATSDIFAARVGQSGATLDINGLAITTAVGDQIRPDIAASTTGKFLVVWQDGRSRTATGFDIFGAIIDKTGTVLVADIPICRVGNDQATPRVSYDPTSDRFLVVWADHRTGTGFDVYGARVSSAGVVLDPDGVAIAASSTDGEFEPDVTFGSDRFLVTWRDNGDIHASRVHANGAAITRDDASDIVVVSLLTKQLQARTAFVGNAAKDFVVIWTDTRNRAATGLDIMGNMVLESTGALDGGEFTVANSAEDESSSTISRPARANGANMELLVAYQRFSIADATFRVKTRKLTIATVATPTLESIAVTPANQTIAKGTTLAYTAIGTFSDGSTQNLTTTATWASSTTAATITAAGVATGANVGATVISAAQSGITGSTHLTVSAATLASITVTPVNPTVALGLTKQFTATGTFTDGTTVDETTVATWTSSDPTVATITSTGLATAVAQGTSLITASFGGFSGSTTMTVGPPVLQSLAINPVDPILPKGGFQLQFQVLGNFSDGTVVDETTTAIWTSSSTAKATIDANGLATSAAAAGPTTITAAIGTISDATTLTVTNDTLQSIAVTPATPTIAKTTSIQFTATGTFGTGPGTFTLDLTTQPLLTWSSVVTTVATISNATGTNGLALGIAVGTTTIKATVGAVVGSTVLTVSNAVLQSIAVTPVNPFVAKTFKIQFTATGTFFDGVTTTFQNLTNQAAWTSSNQAVATITATGLASVKIAGTSTITATFGGKSGSTLLTGTNATLSSIAVTSSGSTTMTKGQTAQLTAIGTFTDGTTLDITTQVGWKSVDNKKVSVNAKGRIKANQKTTPTDAVTATKNGKVGSILITVN